MKSIFIINNSSHELKKSYTFGFNLSFNLSKSEKKVLFISSTLNTNELLQQKIDARKISTKNAIAPFNIYQYSHNLHLLLLTPRNNINLSIKNINEITRLIAKQINLINKEYDYLIIDLKLFWIELDKCLLEYLNIDYLIYFFSCLDFDMIKNIKNYRLVNSINKIKCDYEVVLDDFNKENNESLICYKQLKNNFKDACINTINQNEYNEQIDYTDKKPWLEISITFDDICERIKKKVS